MGARSTATALALADLYPALHLIVQMNEPRPPTNQSTQNSTSQRWDHAPSLPENSRTTSGPCREKPGEIPLQLTSRITIQKRIQATPQNVEAAAVYVLRLLPESDDNGNNVDTEVAAMARLRDLSLLQLANDHELEMLEFLNMLNAVGDGMGRLVLVNKLCAWNNATVAFEVRYQAYAADAHEL